MGFFEDFGRSFGQTVTGANGVIPGALGSVLDFLGLGGPKQDDSGYDLKKIAIYSAIAMGGGYVVYKVATYEKKK